VDTARSIFVGHCEVHICGVRFGFEFLAWAYSKNYEQPATKRNMHHAAAATKTFHRTAANNAATRYMAAS